MRVTQVFGETLRDTPAEIDIASHALLLRAGYVRQVAAGIWAYLPLGLRALRKIERIVREEIEAIGGQELSMPAVQPAELWQRTGRWAKVDETLVRFRDRRGRDMVLAMTHEEAAAALAASEIRSYRQLPQLVYQIQTKFRDEQRPRAGLIRAREFQMKDSYSFDRDEAGLQRQYQAHYDAYFRIFERAGVPAIAVGSDVGIMGGALAHEFMYLTPIGEDTLVICPGCGYAANQEVARMRKQPYDGGPARPMREVHTPGAATIAELAALLQVDVRRTAKAVFYTAEYGIDEPSRLLVAVVRGDMEANPVALLGLSRAVALRPATADEIAAAGAVAGYGSAIGLTAGSALVIADDAVAGASNLVAGANRADYHLLDTNIGRDWQADIVADIALATAGAPCIECGTQLTLQRGVEIGNIFQLGTSYAEALGASFLDEDGASRPLVMGSYGIGIGRLLACVAEHHRDERGLALPAAVAPFDVTLVAIGRNEEVRRVADELYVTLGRAGIEVLYDDRDVSAGIKFADADLRGMPLRLTISDRSLASGGAELKRRSNSETRIVPLAALQVAINNEQ